MTLRRTAMKPSTVSLKQTGFARSIRKEAGAIAKLRTKRCKVCREPFNPARPSMLVCGPVCAEALGRAETAKKARLQDRAKRESLKTRSDHVKEAQVAMNSWVRERDRLAGRPCISSGLPLDWSGNNVDAGHYRSRGSAPHLRFDERNLHSQSKQENRYASGNAVGYRTGLIKRIGLAEVEALEADNTVRKWSVDELKAIKAKYVLLLKQLKGK